VPSLDTTATCPDQTPPIAANGIVAYHDRLVIADGTGGQIVVVDPATGAIRARYGPAQGVTTPPDDLAVAGDGTIYWTGPYTGVVGRILPDGTGSIVATVGLGANPIALTGDGQLLVGRFLQGRGLLRIDPRTGTVTTVSPTLSLNAFAVGPDGRLYAPDSLGGALVAVDPARGTKTVVARGLTLPTAAKLSPDGRTAYVVSNLPAAVHTVTLATGRATTVRARLTALADDVAVAADGHLYVTAFNQPTFTDVAPDGSSRKVAIGRR
jgi:sugar lactone lactonase YvrE